VVREHRLAGVFDRLPVALNGGAAKGVSLHDALTVHDKATDAAPSRASSRRRNLNAGVT
jgi:hypothetical protein